MIRNAPSVASAQPAFVMKAAQNERMAGSVPVFARLVGEASPADFAAQADGSATDNPAESHFGFGDILDILNPLQHLPVIGYVYRAVTGDSISAVADILGGALYGGPVGAGMALAGTLAQEALRSDNPSAPSAPSAQTAAFVPDTAVQDSNAFVALADLRQGLTPYNS